jgi:hypothetical protein
VVTADVLAPDAGPTDRWTLDILLGPHAGGVPPAVLGGLCAFQATVRDTAPQGEYVEAIVLF